MPGNVFRAGPETARVVANPYSKFLQARAARDLTASIPLEGASIFCWAEMEKEIDSAEFILILVEFSRRIASGFVLAIDVAAGKSSCSRIARKRAERRPSSLLACRLYLAAVW